MQEETPPQARRFTFGMNHRLQRNGRKGTKKLCSTGRHSSAIGHALENTEGGARFRLENAHFNTKNDAHKNVIDKEYALENTVRKQDRWELKETSHRGRTHHH